MTISLDTKDDLRARFELALEDATDKRPFCDLTWSAEADQDGYIHIHFLCRTHGAQWRELVAVDATRSAVTVGADHGLVASAGAQKQVNPDDDLSSSEGVPPYDSTPTTAED